MNYRNPSDYAPREDNPLYDDVPTNLIYQPDVYRLAKHFAEKAGLSWIIDIGCGSALKLQSFAENFEILAIDSEFGISMAKQSIPSATLIPHNLESGLPEIPEHILKTAVVICSDVIEHIRRPEKLMSQLARISRAAPYVLISTPDRDRARGWLDMGPPANPTHVREWGASEFVRFMMDCDFEDVPFYGHTINTDVHRVKSTLLTVSGTHAKICLDEKAPVKVAAIIHGFNEVDILGEVINHLQRQGVEVHYFDNWSSDGSWELMSNFLSQGLLASCQRYPEVPTGQYEWHEQLKKTAEYAAELDADWVMHHDADEIRVSPWLGISIRDAISHIDALGFNAIDFTVIDFRFTESTENTASAFESNLIHYEFGRRPGHFSQVKCWKNDKPVALADTGGHSAAFDDRRVFPIKFLLKHYPLRNKAQAETKVFRDRLPRFEKERSAFGWHTQYDQFKDRSGFSSWKFHQLNPWHPVLFSTEYLVERISGIGLVD